MVCAIFTGNFKGHLSSWRPQAVDFAMPFITHDAALLDLCTPSLTTDGCHSSAKMDWSTVVHVRNRSGGIASSFY